MRGPATAAVAAALAEAVRSRENVPGPGRGSRRIGHALAMDSASNNRREGYSVSAPSHRVPGLRLAAALALAACWVASVCPGPAGAQGTPGRPAPVDVLREEHRAGLPLAAPPLGSPGRQRRRPCPSGHARTPDGVRSRQWPYSGH
jgi:hypothetical protein